MTEPYSFKVGDFVRDRAELGGTVVAIGPEWALVEWYNGGGVITKIRVCHLHKARFP